jgi:ADP-heptose:LPS heptosyltransferase
MIPEAIGLTFTPEEVVPSMELGTAETEEVRRSMQSLRGEGYSCVAVNLSAGDPSRYWPGDRWQALLRHVAADRPRTGFLLLTAQGDEHLADEVRAGLPSLRFIQPAGRSFHHFAAGIALSDLVISPDTSAVHIASAFGRPILGLYPAEEWNFRSWQPVGTRFEIARPKEGVVRDIGVDDVIDAFDRLFAANPTA